MTVIDTSVLVALLVKEPDAADLLIRLSQARPPLAVPASCYLEAVMVLRRRAGGRLRLDAFLADNAVTLLGSDARQARLAADAFERFGRGSGHPARLNFGDCLAYAAAATHRAPLLFKGEDFGHTDAERAA